MSMPEPVLTENRRLVEAASSDRGRRAIVLSFPQRQPTADELFEAERAAFEWVRPELMAEHAGEYVAIYRGEPAAFGASDTEAAERFFRIHPDAPVYIGFIGDEPRAVQSRPRR